MSYPAQTDLNLTESSPESTETGIGNDSWLETNTTGLVPAILIITNANWAFFVSLITLSTIFLGVAVIIYVLLWEKQNLHGWNQFSYLVAFLQFNIFFIPALTPGIAHGLVVNPACFTISVANQYFFIASKTWLLIIGFDILWNLWKFEYVIDTGKHRKRFLVYSILGWGFPFGLVSCGIFLNANYQEILQEMDYTDELWVNIPDYGRRHCRLPNWSIWEIFVFSNCLLHILIFVFIIFIIMKHRYSVQKTLAERKESSYKSFFIFLKLFIVVGLSWSYIALQDLLKAGNINTEQGWGWHVFRVIFFLQGVFISLVYIGNVKTFRQLQEKFPQFKTVVTMFQEKVLCCSTPTGRNTSFSSIISFSTSKSKCCPITTEENNSSKTDNLPKSFCRTSISVISKNLTDQFQLKNQQHNFTHKEISQ